MVLNYEGKLQKNIILIYRRVWLLYSL